MKVLKRAALAVLAVTAAVLAVHFLVDPTVDQAAEWIIYGAALPATLFVILYGTTVPWWRTMIGRALLTSSAALALLLDLSLLYKWLGTDYLGRDLIRLTVLSLVFLGAWLKLLALLGEKRHAYRDRHPRPTS